MLMLVFKLEIVSSTCDSFQDNAICVLVDQSCDFLQNQYHSCPCINPFWQSLDSPRRRRDERRHESERARHRSRDGESARVSDRDQKRNKGVAEGDGPLNAEVKSLSHVKDDPPVKRDRSPRGTKRFSESRWHQSFFQVLSFRHYKNRMPPVASVISVPNG
jgi:hypothetical protein